MKAAEWLRKTENKSKLGLYKYRLEGKERAVDIRKQDILSPVVSVSVDTQVMKTWHILYATGQAPSV